MNFESRSTSADPKDVSFVFEAGQDNLESEVLNASLKTPVLVDFWATWCGPCKMLGPILEKLAGEYAGGFKLAKIDCDKEQQLAGMFGVRSIPTVVLIRDGQIADGFAGALPESQVREFLSRNKVQPASRIEAPAAEAVDDHAAGAPRETPQAAIARLREAVAAEPDNAALKLDLALVRARTGDITDAQAVIDGLPADLIEDDRVGTLQAILALNSALASLPSSAELLTRVERDPHDFAARDGLGVLLLLGGDVKAAMEHWLAILAADRGWNDGLARKRLLDAFRIADDEALVAATRRRMSSLLF